MLFNSTMIDVDEDAILIAAVKNRDLHCFDKLYNKYAPMLFGVISRIEKDSHKAEEILNATFVSIWHQIIQFTDNQSTFFTWLVSIARKTALEKINMAGTKSQKKDIFVNGSVENVFSNDFVTPTQIKCFELVYYSGFNVMDVANTLNITAADVKNNIRIVIKSMKER
jgi:DNA-directed RNA polymerase specialized sigma24 family protein